MYLINLQLELRTHYRYCRCVFVISFGVAELNISLISKYIYKYI